MWQCSPNLRTTVRSTVSTRCWHLSFGPLINILHAVVFLSLTVSVQFRLIPQYAYDAYYRLNDTKRQIQTYVFDHIRSTIPRMSLDQIFASRTEISDTVFSRLQSVMKVYGYEIVSTLLGKTSPNELVQFSMNEINVSKRMKEAAPHRADAGMYHIWRVYRYHRFREPLFLTLSLNSTTSERISKVKEAEARAETLYLRGVGISKKRTAIAQGLKTSLLESNGAQCTQDAIDLLLLTQYFDTLAAVGADQMFVHTGIYNFSNSEERKSRKNRGNPWEPNYWS
jgi:regulator of protease activity HflC (stomatin/prohibitin superfamily)